MHIHTSQRVSLPRAATFRPQALGMLLFCARALALLPLARGLICSEKVLFAACFCWIPRLVG